MLILHYTGMPDADQACRWLCNPSSEVSSHYFVHEDGRTEQLVPEARRAWHAGVSFWRGETDINSRSIGVEIANPGHAGGSPDFTEAQIEAVIALSRDICIRNNIFPHMVLGHSDIAPGRKQDPGEKFPWARLHAAGVGHWVEPEPIADGRSLQRGDEGEPVAALRTMFAHYGYGIEIENVFDDRTEAVVTAFQSHFRQARVDGVADASTIATLHRLASAMPSAKG